jgi:hypothetical protein
MLINAMMQTMDTDTLRILSIVLFIINSSDVYGVVFHFSISPFLIVIEVLFFSVFSDDRNFFIFSEETWGSFSKSAIASSIDVNSFTFASSAFFFMITRGAELGLPGGGFVLFLKNIFISSPIRFQVDFYHFATAACPCSVTLSMAVLLNAASSVIGNRSPTGTGRDT